MALFKVTWVFEGAGRGWTESLHLQPSGDLHTGVEGPATKLAEVRAQLLGTEAFIKAIRISKEGTGPDAHLIYKRFRAKRIAVGQGAIDTTTQAAQPDVGILMRCSNETKSRHKHTFLRGIPDRIENQHGVYTPDAFFRDFMAAYIDRLILDQWGWYGVNTLTQKKKIPLVNYEVNAKGLVTFTFRDDIFPNTVFNKRTKVRISGVNRKSSANGVHIVNVQDSKVCQTIHPLGVGPYYFGGVGAWSENEFHRIFSAVDQKVVTRKAGAPLLESVGRAPAKARA